MKLFDEYQKLKNNNIVLSFKGEFSSDLTQSILGVVSSRLDKAEKNVRVRKKVFNVLVESLQNLRRHIGKPVMIYIWTDKKGYYISTGNYIKNGQVEALKEWIDEVNKHDKVSLRSLYKSVLDTTSISEEGGAGLGFIDIARKSGQKLKYEFHEVNNEYSFFCFEININIE